MDGTPQFLPEISARTHISTRTLVQWANRGEGPHMFKLGKRWAAMDVDVERWLREQYASAGGDRHAAA